MTGLRHPLGGLPLPPIVDRLVAHVRACPDDWRDGWERVHQRLRPLPDADGILAHLAFGDPLPDPPELRYTAHPVEIVPLFWNGGDALHYGFAWYDPAIPPVGVSCAPGDDGAVWLGDDPTDAVRNLLAWYTHGVGSEPWIDAELAAGMREEGLALAEALELELPAELSLTSGARSERPVRPHVPEGWRFEEDGDGIGTLAPAALFRPGPLPDHGWDDEAWLAEGLRALDDGFPASALQAFRAAYQASAGGIAGAAALARAYRALGREPLAVRAEAYVLLQGG